MAIELWKVDKAGDATRIPTPAAGEGIELAAGDAIVVNPESGVEMSTSRDGDDLHLETPDGVIVLEGFYAASEDPEAPPAALAFYTADGFELITPEGRFNSSSIGVVESGSGNLPEALPLPESTDFGGEDGLGGRLGEIVDPIAAALVADRSGQRGGPNVDPDLVVITGLGTNEAPSLDGAQRLSVREDLESGGRVGAVVASDADSDLLTYTISGGSDAALFTIDSATGVLSLAPGVQLDFESQTSAAVEVTVSDGREIATETVNIDITDANDAPVIAGLNAFNVLENSVNGTVVGTVGATDADSPAQTLRFAVTGGTGSSAFAVNQTTGEITVLDQAQLDRETRAGFTLEVQVSDNGTPALTDTATITINLGGANEFAPVITSANNATVAENTSVALDVDAADADLPGDTLTYSVSGGVDQALFVIDPVTGVLSFVAPPDFETPLDAGSDNVYDVEVAVSDGGAPVTQAVQITVTGVNDPPDFTSSPNPTAAENQTAVVTVTATDPEMQVPVFSIVGGADAALFDLTGAALTFLAPPDFEAPGDADANNVYQVIIQADDQNGGLSQQLINVAVSPVNDNSPVITSSATFNVDENATAIGTVTATDADLPAETLTFSLSGGADQALFSIDSNTGALSFLSGRDFETPADAGGDNVYDVQVQVSDGTNTATQNIAVTVDPVNDNNPVITSSATFNVDENATAIGTVTATDADLPAETLTYSLSGGADQALFSIDANTGALSFLSGRDFETPADAGGDNVYDVQVQVSDGTNTATQNVAVTVDPVNDNAPVITSSATFSLFENQTAVGTVTATDADLPSETLTYSIAGGADGGLFGIDGTTGALSFLAAPDFETPAGSGATGNDYLVTVGVTDGLTPVQQAVTVSVQDVGPTMITSGNSFNVDENQTAVGAVVAASEGTVTYSISGGADQALFSIDANSGALSFQAGPDFEAPADAGADNVYDVEVTAIGDDGGGPGSAGTDVQTIAVTVGPVNDNNPVITSSATFDVDENETAIGAVTATDADLPAEALTYSLSGGADQALFAIDSNTGALSFLSGRDFEAPADAGGDNVYDVQVQVSDGTNATTQNVAVTVDPVNDNNPVITSSATFNVDENATAIGTVTATDADLPAETLTFSLSGGADQALFSIDSNTGALSFLAGRDFETPADAGGNNVYDVQVQVSDGTNTATQNVAVTVDPVNDNNPVITSSATFNVDENVTAIGTVTATDADLPAETLTYSLSGGADQALFGIDSNTGALSFLSGRDFETPADAGGDNVYDVQVQASDGTNTATQNIAVTVDPVNDNNPVITSSATFNVDENATAIGTVTATDADLPAETLTFSLSGGADQALFSIDANTGALSFLAGRDFEAPADAGGDNVYDVQVQVSDGTNTTTQNVAVTVDPINDNAPVITSSATFSLFENQTAVGTVTATDADLPSETLTYSIAGGADGGLFGIDGTTGALSFLAAPDFETPAGSGATGNDYLVTVGVTDGLTPVQQAVTVSVQDIGPTMITSGNSFNVDENQTAVATVVAVGEGTQTYTITGGADQALFSIDANSGALSFQAGPDFEAPADAGADNVYDVEVTASGDDGGGPGSAGTDVQTIAVTVDPVNDNNPVITSSATFNVDENATAIGTVTATDADLPAETLTFSLSGGADQALFAIDSNTGALSFLAGRDFESPADAGGDNVYDVQVQASDGTNATTQNVAVTVNPVNDNNPVITSSATFNVDENATAIGTVTATDADLPAETLTFSLSGGADQALFSIDSNTGALSFLAGRDFETPADAGGNNVYDVQVQVSDGTNTATQNVAVTVDPVNDNNPVITSSATFNVDENVTAIGTVTATDADLPAETLTYSLSGGADQALFGIDSNTGALSFLSGRDFETPADAGGDNVYDVQVQASDGTNATTQNVAVTVDSVNDNNPVITSSATFNVDENVTAIGTVTATDADLPAETLTFSLSGGADQALFGIDSNTGALSFLAGRDFEAPADDGGNNVYDVQVQVSDGTNTATQNVAVTVDPVNDNAPVITSSATFSLFENQTAVGTVTATDADLPSETLTYSIAGGADSGLFGIDGTTGALSFLAAPDFEAPAGSGATGNDYLVTVGVTDGLTPVQQAVTVSVQDVGPTMITSGNSFNVDENQTAVATVVAVGEGTQTYTITGGADQALFSIDANSGALSFQAGPDFEAPADAGADNVYDVEVTASGDDGGGPGSAGTDVQTIAVTVDSVNDNNPVITSSATFNVDENATAIGTVTATDADLPAETLTFSLSGGADQALFAIDSNTGALSFLAGRDFEAPADAGGDNVYDVQVQVSDGTNATTQNVAVTVDPVNDNNPVITSSATFNVDENATAIGTVTATDADLPAETLTFSLSGGADQALFAIDSNTGALSFLSGRDFETPADAGGDNVYDVQVQVSDGANTATQNVAVTVDPVNDNNPVITSSATFNVDENATAIGTVTATDADLPAEALTFSLSGGADQALFSIDSNTGALSFLSGRDFETPADAGGDNVYDVQVQASDGTNTATQNIAVTVDPVNDNNPVITSSATFNVDENATAIGTVTATDADLPAETLTYSLSGGADQALFGIDSNTGALSFLAGRDFEAPADDGGNNVYDVQVQVSDGTNTTTQNVAVTVDPVNDNAPVITSSATFSLFENQTAVGTVTATDADLPSETLTYSIAGGADGGLFGIDGTTGALSFLAAPDFETPAGSGATGNDYLVTVGVTDGLTPVQQAVTVSVQDIGPTMITSGNAFNVDENVAVITTVTAVGETAPQFTVTGGADQGLFTIGLTTGVLSFASGRDFENPTDTGADNVYEVQITATGSGNDVQTIDVTVDPVNDNNPVITSSATFNVDENATAIGTVTATDADLPAETLTFSLSGGADQALFAIDSNTGALSFLAGRDFEAPADAGGDNVYDVQVQASDGTNATTQNVAVTVDPVNDNNPVITSSATFNVDENATAIGTVTATDADLPAETLTFSLSGGADQALFAIDSNTGALSFLSGRDFETPADAGGDNVYDVQVQVSDGANTATQNVAVTVDPVNDNNPVVTSSATFNVDENATAIGTVTAADADLPAEALTFSLSGGADQALFSIDSNTGALSFLSGRDFETPADAGGDNVYDVQVQASDGTNTATQNIAVTVDPVNDNNPVITSSATFNVDENATAIGTVTAADADLPAETLTFSLSGGADQALFSIDANTGALSFLAGRDFEAPADAGGDNVYDVQVQVSDGTNTTTQNVAVTVDPVNDNAPVITSSATFSLFENQTAVGTVTATDADLPSETLTYSIAGGADGGLFGIDGTTGALSFLAAPDFETPAGSGATGNDYLVTVGVTDGLTPVQQAVTVSVQDIGPTMITSGNAFNVDENVAVITTVTAVGETAPQFTVTGGADQGLFTIGLTTGVLSFASGRDFENPTDTGADNVYEVQITATGSGNDVQTIDVTVDPVNDNNPVITSSATFNVDENATAIGTVTATDADLPAETLTFSLSGGADQALFAIDSNTGALSFLAGRDFEAPADAGGDNVYDVQVQASDGTNATTQNVAVTVDPVNDNNPVITSSATFNVDENATAIGTVTATDADLPAETLTFSLSGGADQALFAIDSNTGALSFLAGRDFETPADAGGDNEYDVQVQVSDGANTATQNVAVTVDPVNDNNPVVTSSATFNVDENATAIGTVTAADADLPAETLTFSLSGGADQALFSIDSNTGALSFLSGRDFETPADAGGDNVYDVQVQASDGTNTATQNIAVTVDPVNDNNPVITSSATFNVDENATAIGTVTAADADLPAETLTFSLSGGADQALFSIDANTGALSFLAGRDFEAPTDAGGNNVYDVQVQVSDGTNTATQNVAVTVDPVNDNNPVITSSATFNIDENATAIGTVTATDADLPADTLTFSLSGGADQAFFAIDSNTGALSFLSGRDFETPADAGGDNVYDVQVQAFDGTNATTQNVAVTIDPVNEAPTNIGASPGTRTVVEDIASNLDLSAIEIADVDAGTGMLTVRLTASSTLFGASTGGVVAADSGTSVLSLTGQLGALNTYLNNPANIQYLGDPDVNGAGAGSLLIEVSDNGNSGAGGGGFQDFGTIAVDITADNDAPVITAPGLVSDPSSIAVSVTDVDAGAGPIQVTLTTGGQGPVSLNGTAGLSFAFSDGNGTGQGDGTLDETMVFRGSPTAVNTALGDLNWGVSGNGLTLDITVADLGNTGAVVTNLTDSVTLTTSINGPPDARDDAFAVLENDNLSGQNVFLNNGSGADSDPDGDDIDVTDVRDSLGASRTVGVQFMNPSGALVTLFAAGAFTYNTNGAFEAFAAGQVTTDTVGYTISDNVSGSDTATVTVTITGQNDAPVLADTTVSLTAVAQDALAPSGTIAAVGGTTVSSIAALGGNITDVDTGALAGIAVTDLDDSNGTWFFTINNGATAWTQINAAAVGDSNALLLAVDGSNTGLYFQPDPGFSGNTPAALTFHAWDQTTGSNGGFANPGAGGGTSAFSAATDTASLNVTGASGPVVVVDLDGLNGGDSNADGRDDGFKINGAGGSTNINLGDHLGEAVALVGDVNGDGFGDILVGASRADTSNFDTGAAYLIYGGPNSTLNALATGTIGFDVRAIDGQNGMAVAGPNGSDLAGRRIGGGGDLDGDGYADFIVGDLRVDFGAGTLPQEAYVVLGDTTAVLDARHDSGGANGFSLAGLDGSNGANLVAAPVPGQIIMDVAIAGDLDGDGIDDYLVSQPGGDNDSATPGTAYLIFGDADGDGVADGNLNDIDGADLPSAAPGAGVLNFTGAAGTGVFGKSIAGIGDINGDGFGDFAVADTSSSAKGKVYVFFGDTRANLTTLANDVTNQTGDLPSGADSLDGTHTPYNGGFILDNTTSRFFNAAGFDVTGIGDFNGDGFSDFAIAAPKTSGGVVYVVYGKSGGFGNLDLVTDFDDLAEQNSNGFRVTSTNDFSADGVRNGNGGPIGSDFGNSISGGGDVNGDGYDDLIIAEAGDGAAYILFGTPDIASLARQALNPVLDAGLFVDVGDSGAEFESGNFLAGAGVKLTTASNSADMNVAIGADINGDGYDEALIGTPFASPPTSSDQGAGQVFVVYGQDFSNGAVVDNSPQTATGDGDALIGTRLDDTLSSSTHSQVTLAGGNGDDLLLVNGAERSVDGGGGVDFLGLSQTTVALDFTAVVPANSIANSRFSNLEGIDLSDGDDGDSVRLNVQDLLDLTSASSLTSDDALTTLNGHILRILGDIGGDADDVTALGFGGTPADTLVVGGVTFDQYNATGADGFLLVQQGLELSLA